MINFSRPRNEMFRPLKLYLQFLNERLFLFLSLSLFLSGVSYLERNASNYVFQLLKLSTFDGVLLHAHLRHFYTPRYYALLLFPIFYIPNFGDVTFARSTLQTFIFLPGYTRVKQLPSVDIRTYREFFQPFELVFKIVARPLVFILR